MTDSEADNELEPGAFVEDPELFEAIADLYDVTPAEAREIARFEQWMALEVGDPIHEAFGDHLITIEAGSPERLMIIYVSGDADAIEAMARELMGTNGDVEVRGGFLSVNEVSDHWYRIEEALIEAGLSVAGAIRPNEIGVYASDVARAQQIIATLDVPAEITVVVEHSGGFVVDLNRLEQP